MNRLDVEINIIKRIIDAIGVAASFPIEFNYPSKWWLEKDWR